MATDRPFDILLVEDSPSDANLITACFGQSEVKNRIHHVSSGERALAFLHRGVQFADAARPDLILLDLGLPDMDGLEILQAAKADPSLKSIPVIVLTASAIQEDIHRAYDLQAACYFSKPMDLEGFEELVKSIEETWLKRVQLPSDETSQAEATD